MNRILGIDPGLSSTGYGILEKRNSMIVHVSHGVIRTDACDTTGIRLLGMATELKKIIKKYKPDSAAVESIFFAKNIKTAIPVAQARGVILYVLAGSGIDFSEYTPLQVKQAVVGRGRAEKQQVQAMLKLILGLAEIPAPDHAADALAIAVCHINRAAVLAAYVSGR
jgi:crossover junction endodeoxyribonuclease RuvC